MVLAGVLIYALIYSYLTLSKFNAFNATAADLGINASMLYGVFHGSLSLSPGKTGFINTGKLIYLILAPFYNLYPHEQVLLIFQSVWISLCSIPIYFIAKMKTPGRFIPVAVSLLWLLYYPMAGVNWFDFHFMALFPTFFLSAFAFSIYGRWKIALVFFLLATITDFLIPFVMISYSSVTLYLDYKNGRRIGKNHTAWILITFSIFIVTNVLFGFSYTLQYLYNASTTIAVFNASFPEIGFYFILIMAPFLFFSVLAPEFLILLLPFFLLVSFSGFDFYLRTYYIQYPSLTAPIIFLSAIYGMHHFNEGALSRNRHHIKRLLKPAVVSMLMLNTILPLLFTPAGNMVTQPVFNSNLYGASTYSAYTYNTPYYISQTNADLYLGEMILLIPQGASVTGQNNMPQLLQGYEYYWPKEILNGTNVGIYPEYAIVDPYNWFYNNPIFPGENPNYTAKNAFNKLLSTGLYGIYAKAYGITLIKKDYTEVPLFNLTNA